MGSWQTGFLLLLFSLLISFFNTQTFFFLERGLVANKVVGMLHILNVRESSKWVILIFLLVDRFFVDSWDELDIKKKEKRKKRDWILFQEKSIFDFFFR